MSKKKKVKISRYNGHAVIKGPNGSSALIDWKSYQETKDALLRQGFEVEEQ
jgi:hypothetical protein